MGERQAFASVRQSGSSSMRMRCRGWPSRSRLISLAGLPLRCPRATVLDGDIAYDGTSDPTTIPAATGGNPKVTMLEETRFQMDLGPACPDSGGSAEGSAPRLRRIGTLRGLRGRLRGGLQDVAGPGCQVQT